MLILVVLLWTELCPSLWVPSLSGCMELILSGVQESAFCLVEFHQVSAIPFLQSVDALQRAALLSSVSCCLLNHPQTCWSYFLLYHQWKAASATNVHVVSEDIKLHLSQHEPFRNALCGYLLVWLQTADHYGDQGSGASTYIPQPAAQHPIHISLICLQSWNRGLCQKCYCSHSKWYLPLFFAFEILIRKLVFCHTRIIHF